MHGYSCLCTNYQVWYTIAQHNEVFWDNTMISTELIINKTLAYLHHGQVLIYCS